MPKLPAWLKYLLKLGISVLALWFISTKVDFKLAWQSIRNADPGWLLAAFLVYNVSKWIGLVRISAYGRCLHIRIGLRFNLLAYYISAFYNLFLPGSVSGDAYKVYMFRQRFAGRTRHYVAMVFLDRLSGMAILACFVVAMAPLAAGQLIPESLHWLCFLAAAGAIPVWYLLHRWLFPKFIRVFAISTLASIAVQATQVLTALCILIALGGQGHTWSYLFLFLLATAAAVLPLTIGGLGAREFVLAEGAVILAIDPVIGGALGFVFFLITAASAIPGLFLTWTTRNLRRGTGAKSESPS